MGEVTLSNTIVNQSDLIEAQRRDGEGVSLVRVQALYRQDVGRECDGGTLLHIMACVRGSLLGAGASKSRGRLGMREL